MKQIHRLCMCVLLSLSVVGCATTKGTVWGGRYQSPINNFTVALPDWGSLKIQDDGNNLGGRVSFYDDFGKLQAISYLRLDEYTESAVQDHEQKEAAYSSFLKTYAVPSLFGQASQGTQILHEEFLGEGENSIYFAVVSIPEGSTMFDLMQKKRLDSVRGLIIFDRRGFMYMVESQMNSIFNIEKPSSLNTRQLESTQSTLKRIKDSMVFK